MSSCDDLQCCLSALNLSVTKVEFVKSKPSLFSFFSIWRLKLSFLLLVFLLFLRCFVRKRISWLGKGNVRPQLLCFPKVTWFNSPKINPPLLLQGWCTMTQLSIKGMQLFTECSAQYGNTFLLPFGPLNVLATSDLQIISKLLSSNDPCHLQKSGYIYKRLFVPELHDGLFVSKFSVWLPQRKCLSRGLTYNSILSYLRIVNRHAWELTSGILKLTLKNGILQDGKIFSECLGLHLLRFTCELVTGPGTYSSNANIEKIRESIETHKECLLYVFQHPYLFLRPLWNCHPKKIVSDRATRQMLTAMRQMIASHKFQRSKDCNQHKADSNSTAEMKFKPLLELMMDSKWTEKEILDNFATFIFAEHEALFAAIQFTLFQLALNPEHQNKARAEVDTLFSEKSANANTCGAVFLSITDLAPLKFLELCILESLRLFPPVPIFARRLQAPLKINERVHLPSGQTVMVMPWVLHRDPFLYPKPLCFDPYRFSGESVRTRPHYAYLPFSAGRRNCLGLKLSQIQMKIMLAWILRHFEISTTDNLENVKLFYAVRVIPERDFHLSFKRRQ